jgi:MOSC domain-containing protein YiiM
MDVREGSPRPRVVSVQVGLPEDRDVPLPSGRPGPPLRTAIWRASVDGPITVDRLGASGDAVGDTDNHGGPDKALCAYVADHLPAWSDRLGVEMAPGAFGENLSLTGLDEEQVAIGDVHRIGTVVTQVSQPRAPCATLARRWQVHDLVIQVRASRRTGWYLRVLEPGELQAGQAVELLERLNPAWTIARLNALLYGPAEEERLYPGADAGAAAHAAELPELSDEWRLMLRRVALG